MSSFPAARCLIDTVAGGTITPIGTPTTFINDYFSANTSVTVGTHPPCCCGPTCSCQEHCASVFQPINASKTVFINDLPVVRQTDIAVCGHPITTGSPDVFFG